MYFILYNHYPKPYFVINNVSPKCRRYQPCYFPRNTKKKNCFSYFLLLNILKTVIVRCLASDRRFIWSIALRIELSSYREQPWFSTFFLLVVHQIFMSSCLLEVPYNFETWISEWVRPINVLYLTNFLPCIATKSTFFLLI